MRHDMLALSKSDGCNKKSWDKCTSTKQSQGVGVRIAETVMGHAISPFFAAIQVLERC